MLDARRDLALLIVSLAACVPGPRVLEAPPAGKAVAALYVIAEEGRPPIVWVSDLGPSSEALPEIARAQGSRIDLYAFHYGCPIDVLGLKKGRQEISNATEGHPIPPGNVIFASRVDDQGQSAWERLRMREVPADIAAIRIAREIRCAKYKLERIAIPDTAATSSVSITYPTFGIPLDQETLIVAINDGRFFRVTSSAVEPISVAPDAPFLAYFLRDDGDLWLYGPNGRLAKGRVDALEGSWEAMPPSPGVLGQFLAWIDGPRYGEGFELFMLNDGGLFARFDGEKWTQLDFSLQPLNELPFGGVAWIRPSEAVAVMSWNRRALRYKDGTVTEEQVLPDSAGDMPSLRAVAELPGMGTVAGTAGGRLFTNQEAGGEWSQLLDSPIQSRFGFFPAISDIEQLDDGAFFGGGGGHFSQYQPELHTDTDYCNYKEAPPADDLVVGDALAQFHVFRIEVLPCGYALLSKQLAFEGDAEITFLTRKQ